MPSRKCRRTSNWHWRADEEAQGGVDYWPGFVDALSTLLLAIMFLLSVFVLAQFLLSREITGKDAVLNRLNAQINELTSLLALEQSNRQDVGRSVVEPANISQCDRRRA